MIIGYARVSTNTQDTEAQVEQLTSAGAERIYTDQAESGTKTHRPGLDSMLDAARAGDIIMVTKIDRLGRSLIDLVNQVNSFHERGIQLRVLDQDIDTTTSQGRLVFNLFASFAEFEVELIRERTRKGLEHARAQGRVGGQRPAFTAEQVKKVHKLYRVNKLSQREIAAQLGVNQSTVSRALRGEG